jgi:hypothetical protein
MLLSVAALRSGGLGVSFDGLELEFDEIVFEKDRLRDG